jgi:hypothetical protein
VTRDNSTASQSVRSEGPNAVGVYSRRYATEESGRRNDDGNPRWSEKSTIYEGEGPRSSPAILGEKNSFHSAKNDRYQLPPLNVTNACAEAWGERQE